MRHLANHPRTPCTIFVGVMPTKAAVTRLKLSAGAPAMMASKSFGYRWASCMACRPPLEHPMKKDFSAALRKDVKSNVRVLYLSLRRDVPALVSLAILDRLVGHNDKEVLSRKIRESSQNLTEAKMYEAEAVLAKGPAVADPMP